MENAEKIFGPTCKTSTHKIDWQGTSYQGYLAFAEGIATHLGEYCYQQLESLIDTAIQKKTPVNLITHEESNDKVEIDEQRSVKKRKL